MGLNSTHLDLIFNVENDFNPSQQSKFFATTKLMCYYRDNENTPIILET